jgi:hypothetical protein
MPDSEFLNFEGIIGIDQVRILGFNFPSFVIINQNAVPRQTRLHSLHQLSPGNLSHLSLLVTQVSGMPIAWAESKINSA